MGTLEVELLKYTSTGNNPERTGQTHTVRYLSPFYGVTPQRGTQPNDGYDFTQKSYGFWMVPPDVGTKVIVIFLEDNASQGYWIGCVQDQFMNFMLPDGRASTKATTEATPSALRNLKLPVGEYNKRVETGEGKDPTKFKKPYNKDFLQVLETQGIYKDEIRGTTTSSARRDIPSMVFGFSSPGPLDKRPGAPKYAYGNQGSKAEQFYNRLGGSSLVFDDGDDKFIRRVHAEDGPPEYANVEANDVQGDQTIPHNELVRLRTRTGHQILLHNSEDLIYIINSRGTAWVELTSDGKIDIHADDSISLMTGADLNITAERDINMEAGRNINMKATARYSGVQQQDINGNESGRVQIESVFNTNIDVGKDYKLTVHDFSDTVVENKMKVLVKDDYHFHTNKSRYQRSDAMTHETSGFSWYRKSDVDIHDIAVENIYERAGATIHESAAEGMYSQAGGAIYRKAAFSIYDQAATNINLKAGGIIAGDADQIHWNSGLAASSSDATIATDATNPEDAVEVVHLPTISLSYIPPGSENPEGYESILCRAPQHEPWMQHENMNPLAYKPHETDRESPGALTESPFRPLTPDTFAKGADTRAFNSQQKSRVAGGGVPVTPATGSTVDPLGPDTFDPRQEEGRSITGQVPGDLIDFIKSEEGFRNTAYWDHAQYSIGYGTRALSANEVITQDEAERRLADNVSRFRQEVVRYGQDNGYNWTSPQIDALTSFSYNLGTGSLSQVTENGTRDNNTIAEKMTLYYNAGGSPVNGLIERRINESIWFRSGIKSER
jgi:GH24 family phage-related lysozyme (muramidase)